MAYINEIYVPQISVSEVVPQVVEMKDLDDTLTNVVVSAKRYDTTNSSDTGTDVSSKVSISGNQVTVSNIWGGAETPAAGSYRVCVKLRNPSSTVLCEFNLYQRVV